MRDRRGPMLAERETAVRPTRWPKAIRTPIGLAVAFWPYILVFALMFLATLL